MPELSLYQELELYPPRSSVTNRMGFNNSSATEQFRFENNTTADTLFIGEDGGTGVTFDNTGVATFGTPPVLTTTNASATRVWTCTGASGVGEWADATGGGVGSGDTVTWTGAHTFDQTITSDVVSGDALISTNGDITLTNGALNVGGLATFSDDVNVGNSGGTVVNIGNTGNNDDAVLEINKGTNSGSASYLWFKRNELRTFYIGEPQGGAASAFFRAVRTGNITNVADKDSAGIGSLIVITTLNNHNLTTGDSVTIEDVEGATEANGTWTITDTGDKTFELQTSSWAGNTYTASTGTFWGDVLGGLEIDSGGNGGFSGTLDVASTLTAGTVTDGAGFTATGGNITDLTNVTMDGTLSGATSVSATTLTDGAGFTVTGGNITDLTNVTMDGTLSGATSVSATTLTDGVGFTVTGGNITDLTNVTMDGTLSGATSVSATTLTDTAFTTTAGAVSGVTTLAASDTVTLSKASGNAIDVTAGGSINVGSTGSITTASGNITSTSGTVQGATVTDGVGFTVTGGNITDLTNVTMDGTLSGATSVSATTLTDGVGFTATGGNITDLTNVTMDGTLSGATSVSATTLTDGAGFTATGGDITGVNDLTVNGNAFFNEDVTIAGTGMTSVTVGESVGGHNAFLKIQKHTESSSSSFLQFAKNTGPEFYLADAQYGGAKLSFYYSDSTVNGTVESVQDNVDDGGIAAGTARITSTGHGLTTSDFVVIWGVTGSGDAARLNGIHEVIATTTDTFDISPIAYTSSSGESGGTWHQRGGGFDLNRDTGLVEIDIPISSSVASGDAFSATNGDITLTNGGVTADSLTITGGSPAANYVLTTTAGDGVATWQPTPSSYTALTVEGTSANTTITMTGDNGGGDYDNIIAFNHATNGNEFNITHNVSADTLAITENGSHGILLNNRGTVLMTADQTAGGTFDNDTEPSGLRLVMEDTADDLDTSIGKGLVLMGEQPNIVFAEENDNRHFAVYHQREALCFTPVASSTSWSNATGTMTLSRNVEPAVEFRLNGPVFRGWINDSQGDLTMKLERNFSGSGVNRTSYLAFTDLERGEFRMGMGTLDHDFSFQRVKSGRVTGVTLATDPVVRTAKDHNLSNGDYVRIENTSTEIDTMVEISSVTSNTFTIVGGNTTSTSSTGSYNKMEIVGTAVSNVTDNGSGLIRVTTSASHGLQPDDPVTITGVNGVPANGDWIALTTGSTTIDLKDSTFSGTYTSGGLVGTPEYEEAMQIDNQSGDLLVQSDVSAVNITASSSVEGATLTDGAGFTATGGNITDLTNVTMDGTLSGATSVSATTLTDTAFSTTAGAVTGVTTLAASGTVTLSKASGNALDLTGGGSINVGSSGSITVNSGNITTSSGSMSAVSFDSSAGTGVDALVNDSGGNITLSGGTSTVTAVSLTDGTATLTGGELTGLTSFSTSVLGLENANVIPNGVIPSVTSSNSGFASTVDILAIEWAEELGYYIAETNAATGTYYYSADGDSWSSSTLSSVAKGVNRLKYVGGVLFKLSNDSSQLSFNTSTDPTSVGWTTSTTSLGHESNDAVNGVAYRPANTRFVLVVQTDTANANKTLFYADASDLTSWTAITDPTGFTAGTDVGASIEYAPSLDLFVFIANGSANENIFTSADGSSFNNTSVTLPSTGITTWEDLAWSEEVGLFVAVNTTVGTTIMTSTDGLTWTSQTMDRSLARSQVRWESSLGLFLIAADDGTDGYIEASADGLTWIVLDTFTSRTSKSLAYSANNREILTGCFAATESIRRTVVDPLSLPTSSLAVGGSMKAVQVTDGYLSIENGEIDSVSNVSSDNFTGAGTGAIHAINPTEVSRRDVDTHSTVQTTIGLTAVQWGENNGFFFTCAREDASSTRHHAYSYDGLTWTAASTLGKLQNVVYTNDIMFALGNGGTSPYLYYNLSTDPTSWSSITTNFTNGSSIGGITDLAHKRDSATGNDIYILVCTQASPYDAVAWRKEGPDNLSENLWTAIGNSAFSTAANDDLQGIAYSHSLDLWVAVGNSDKLYSSTDDGANWTAASSTSTGNNWVAVDYSDEAGVFVAVASDSSAGQIAYSSNGTSWKTVTASPSGFLKVRWDRYAKMFFASGTNVSLTTGHNGWVYTSTDGIRWNKLLALPETGLEFSDAAYSPSLKRLVACGIVSSTDLEYVATCEVEALGVLGSVYAGDVRTFGVDAHSISLDTRGVTNPRIEFDASSDQLFAIQANPLIDQLSITEDSGEGITLNNSGSVTCSQNLTVNGTLSAAGSNFDVDGSGNVTVGGTLSASSSNFDVDGSGNVTVGGTLSTSSGNFDVDGSGNVTVGGTLSTSSGNFDVDGSGNVTVGGTLSGATGITTEGLTVNETTVASALTIGSGTNAVPTNLRLFNGTDDSYIRFFKDSNSYFQFHNVTASNVLQLEAPQASGGLVNAMTVDADGVISFAKNVTSSGTVQGGSISDGGFTATGGAFSGVASLTASGTVQGGSLSTGTGFTANAATVTLDGGSGVSSVLNINSQSATTATTGTIAFKDGATTDFSIIHNPKTNDLKIGTGASATNGISMDSGGNITMSGALSADGGSFAVDTSGNTTVGNNATSAISAMSTSGGNHTITTGTNHGLDTGDVVLVKDITGTVSSEVNDKCFAINVTSETQFTLLNSGDTGTRTSGGTIQRVDLHVDKGTETIMQKATVLGTVTAQGALVVGSEYGETTSATIGVNGYTNPSSSTDYNAVDHGDASCGEFATDSSHLKWRQHRIYTTACSSTSIIILTPYNFNATFDDSAEAIEFFVKDVQNNYFEVWCQTGGSSTTLSFFYLVLDKPATTTSTNSWSFNADPTV